MQGNKWILWVPTKQQVKHSSDTMSDFCAQRSDTNSGHRWASWMPHALYVCHADISRTPRPICSIVGRCVAAEVQRRNLVPFWTRDVYQHILNQRCSVQWRGGVALAPWRHGSADWNWAHPTRHRVLSHTGQTSHTKDKVIAPEGATGSLALPLCCELMGKRTYTKWRLVTIAAREKKKGGGEKVKRVWISRLTWSAGDSKFLSAEVC